MTQATEPQVRAGREADLDALTEIYNHYVRETSITFDTRPFTPAERLPWLLSHPEDGPHRLLVAQEAGIPSDGGSPRLLGYATSSPFRPRPAYATSVETSVYLAPDAGGRGLGTLLYQRLFEALAEEDLHRAYAGIALPNEASVRLHRRFGFAHIGTEHEVGRKFGRFIDVSRYEKPLGALARPAGGAARTYIQRGVWPAPGSHCDDDRSPHAEPPHAPPRTRTTPARGSAVRPCEER